MSTPRKSVGGNWMLKLLRRAGPALRGAWAWAVSRDWRIWAIILAMVVAVIGTIVIYLRDDWQDPATHMGAVFASWVGGVALFVVIGSIVSFVSLAQPERESFDSRARILFRRQRGKHIDYIISRLAEEFEQYAESTTLSITIREYNEPSRKYRIEIYQEATVASYIEDIPTTYSSQIEYVDVTLPPAGGAENILTRVAVDGRPNGRQYHKFRDSITQDVTTRIDPFRTVKIESEIAFWVQSETEDNTHTPARYTQHFAMEFTNAIGEVVFIKFTTDQGRNWETITLEPGLSKQAFVVRDLRPSGVICNFRLLPPQLRAAP